jgi:hypothetical protein
MQGSYYIHKTINILQHINRIKDKTHIIISTGVEKAFDKIEHPFMITALAKPGIERMYLNASKRN